MIPKNLFMCKVGNTVSREEEDNIYLARKNNPDFKVKLLTEANWESLTGASVFESKTVRFLLDSGKYGKASDMIRWIALRKLGGVAIDMDVACLKTFRPLLPCHCFVSTDGMACNAVVGIEANSGIAEDMIVALRQNPDKSTDVILEQVISQREMEVERLRNELTLARSHEIGGLNIVPATMSVHLCRGEDLQIVTKAVRAIAGL